MIENKLMPFNDMAGYLLSYFRAINFESEALRKILFHIFKIYIRFDLNLF